MNKLTFSTHDGNILINGQVVAPLSLSDFKMVAEKYRVAYEEFSPNIGWITIGIDVELSSNEFGMNIFYNENILKMCSFSWGGGTSALKGYDTTEGELISDKNKLTKLVARILSKAPDKKSYNNDIFHIGGD
jgi:hypothetical protein